VRLLSVSMNPLRCLIDILIILFHQFGRHSIRLLIRLKPIDICLQMVDLRMSSISRSVAVKPTLNRRIVEKRLFDSALAYGSNRRRMPYITHQYSSGTFRLLVLSNTL
jgi:hypothetical protein